MDNSANDYIDRLVAWLNENRPNGAPYEYTTGPKMFKVTASHCGQTSVHCFVAATSFTNKALGSVQAGQIFKPAGWSKPARHARGDMFNPCTWDHTFGEYSVRYLK